MMQCKICATEAGPKSSVGYSGESSFFTSIEELVIHIITEHAFFTKHAVLEYYKDYLSIGD
jgi:hypothetical protein